MSPAKPTRRAKPRPTRTPSKAKTSKVKPKTPSRSKLRAATLAQYLDSLPPARRAAVSAARAFIQQHLPAGYEEMMSAGMIVWAVPLSRLPKTYNGHPLWYIAVGAQKHYNAMYLMCAYGSPKLTDLLKTSFKQAGKKLDMGKSCLRFQTLDDLELGSVGQVIASTPMEKYVETYENRSKYKSINRSI
jgi:hypothetical protein